MTNAEPRFLLYHDPAGLSGAIAAALEAEAHIILEPVETLYRDPAACIDPAVILVDQSLATRSGEHRDLPHHLVVVAADAAAEGVLGAAAELSFAGVYEASAQLALLRAAFMLSAERLQSAAAQLDLEQSREQLTELNRIGMGLMMQRDRPALLRQILRHVMRFTVSDVGAVFIAVKREDGTPELRFRLLMCDSLDDLGAYQDKVVPFNSETFIGYAAMSKQPLLHDDIHDLPPDTPYSVGWLGTQREDYWITSSLAIPMIGQRGDVVGVFALANHKTDPDARIRGRKDNERWVAPYTERDVQLGFSIAGQAAIGIENVMLLRRIENLFESFIKASVIAIDQRDPTTAGHSIRVARLTTDLALALEHVDTGPYRDVRLTEQQVKELRYAALLHDFGKIGVREDVLVKAMKLPPQLNERVESRFDLIHCTLLLEYQKERARLIEEGAGGSALDQLEEQFNDRLTELDRFRDIVHTANRPSILERDTFAMLDDVAGRTYQRPDGRVEPYLAPDELHFLQIPLGSLDEHERLEVQSHAAQTYAYLSQIPWLEEYDMIPRYAAAHHEKLDGSGYPHHLVAQDIPVQTRLITLADIFDALTASDRPYKRAVPTETALDIIRSETDAGMLDPDLVQMMIEGQVYRRIIEEDWRTF